MTYFTHRRAPEPHQPAFRREGTNIAYPVDDDGDRLYTEADYAVPADGDAFLPDEANDAPVSPFSYAGSYDTTMADPDEDALLADDDPLALELLTEEERQELRRSNWRLMAGLADFAGVILGTAAILVLVALLVSLVNWLVADVSQTFTLWQMRL